MNIKNQIRLSVLISLILVVVISASIILSFQNMQDQRDQEALAADVVRGGYELTYLSNDYLINAEPRARLQWEERYSSLQPIIIELKPGNVEEAESLETIREYNEKTGTLFREIPEPGTLNAGAVLFPASYQQVTWSRINVQSQGMIYEAWRLRHLYNDDVSEARFWNNVLVVVLMVLMLIIIGINYLLISRRLVRSIREVNTGSEAFAACNFDYRIPVTADDEIGGIARRLNSMAEQIRSVTASRDELDREVDQRRRAEDALTVKNTDLKAAYEEIAANEEELKANFDELVHSQRALTESEQKYRNLYQYAQVGLFETSLKDATVVACNQRYAELYGAGSVEAALGQDVRSVYVHPKERDEVARILRETGQITDHVIRFRNRKTGREFWGQFSARYNYDRDVAEGTIIDITEQKEAEEKIRETNEYLHKLIDFANAPIVIWNPDYTITRFNHAFERITGRTEQEVLGHPLETLFPEAVRKDALVSIKRTLEGERWESVKIPVTGADGAQHTLLWNSANILSAEAELISTIAHGIDITDRERAEEQLKASEHSLTDIVEKLNEAQHIALIGSWEWNLVTNRVWWSDETYRIFGVTPQDFGPGFDENSRFIHPDDLEKYRRSFEHSFQTGEPLDVDLRLVTGDKTLKYCHAKGKILYDAAGGTPSRFVGTLSDITGRRQADAELAAAQRQYRDLFENVSIGILRSTPGPQGTIIEANPAALRIFDADSREQLLTVRPSDLYLDHDERRRISEEIVAKGAIDSMEVRYKTLKGRPFWGSITSAKRIAEDGQVYFDNTIEDISGRKDAELALHQSEERFRTLVEQLPLGVVMSRRDDTGENVLYFNRGFSEITGYTIELVPTFEAWALRAFPDPVYRLDRTRVALEMYTEAGRDNTSQPRISLVTCNDGNVKEIEFRYTDLSVFGFWTLRDITDQKRSEEALKASEEKFSTAFKTSPYAITISRIKDGSFIEVNDAFTPITGFTREEALSGSSGGFGLWVDAEDRKRVISTLLDGRTVSGEEFGFRRKNGEIITGLFSARIISLNNEPCILSSVNDISDRKRAEKALRESEAHLLAVLDATPFPIALVDVFDNNIHFWSRSALTLFGHTAPTAAEWYEIAYPDPGYRREVLERWKPALEKAQLSGQVVNAGEYRVTCQDGSVRTCELYAVFLDDLLIVTFNDITERNLAEGALRKSEENYRSLFESMIEGFAYCQMIYDNNGLPEDFVYLSVNPSFNRIIGITTIIGKRVTEVFPGIRETIPEIFEIYGRVARTGNPEVFDLDFKAIGKWLHISVSSPAEEHFMAVFEDITDRKRAEDALRETTDYFRNLLDYANAPIIVWDTKFRITRFNHAFEYLTGRTEKEVAGQHFALLFPVLSRETSLEQIQKTLAGERWESVEIPILHVSGETRIVLWNSANIVDPNGAVVSTIAQGLDITDRKLSEVQREMLIKDLEQKNAELERFTYTVSHDLKSPLITIKGFAGLLEADSLKGDPVQLKKDIKRIIDAADTMQDLLVDLIELSRVGKIIKPPQKIPFGTIAREAVNLLAGPLTERNVMVSIAPDMPVVNVDSTRIREVMVNLLENAVKFLGERPDPEIRIGADSTGETPVFFVQDNGVGINPRYLERIFNLFERLDAAAPGTGIGLTIARRIVEVHGGRIWAESEGEGKGTTFRFTLPGPAEEGPQEILK